MTTPNRPPLSPAAWQGSEHERLDAAVEAFITEIEDNGLQE